LILNWNNSISGCNLRCCLESRNARAKSACFPETSALEAGSRPLSAAFHGAEFAFFPAGNFLPPENGHV
jgi:hypothetical protein